LKIRTEQLKGQDRRQIEEEILDQLTNKYKEKEA